VISVTSADFNLQGARRTQPDGADLKLKVVGVARDVKPYDSFAIANILITNTPKSFRFCSLFPAFR
jgi:hypothetical protein